MCRVGCLDFRDGGRFGFRDGCRCGWRQSAAPACPCLLFLWRIFWLLLGFVPPPPPGAARFARGWGDFVAVMLRMFFLAVFLAPFRGHLFGGGWVGVFLVGVLLLEGVVGSLTDCLPAPLVCRSWPLGPGECSWPFGLVLSAAKCLGLGCQMEEVWARWRADLTQCEGWAWPVQSCERGGFVPRAF